MQILILGMHRSGTSMTTRMVNMMGAYFGPEGSVGEITIDNPKGFWERPEIFKLNDALLAAHGCSWHDLRQWNFRDAAHIPEKLVGNLKKTILGMDAFRPWVLKDPRLCLLLPAWRPHLEVPVAVFVHRNPVEIALSLQKRDGFPLEYGIALWEYYTVGMLNATVGMPRIHIRHHEMMEKPVRTAESLFKQLLKFGTRRLELPSEREIRAFIDPALYRSRPAQTDFKLSPAQVTLAEIVQGKRPQGEAVSVSPAAKTLIQQGFVPAVAKGAK
jgi:hypothetical protein